MRAPHTPPMYVRAGGMRTRARTPPHPPRHRGYTRVGVRARVGVRIPYVGVRAHIPKMGVPRRGAGGTPGPYESRGNPLGGSSPGPIRRDQGSARSGAEQEENIQKSPTSRQISDKLGQVTPALTRPSDHLFAILRPHLAPPQGVCAPPCARGVRAPPVYARTPYARTHVQG
eukprot:gene15769-biopygen23222